MANPTPMSTAFGWAILSTVAFIAVVGEPDFWAENVCNRTVTVRKDKLVEEPVKYEITYDSYCGILPCKKSRTEIRNDTKVKTSLESMEVAECCPGYAEALDRSCKPVCLQSCANGKCIKPNVCDCNPTPTETSPGFTGSKCNMFTCLSGNKWGAKCDKDCNCPMNSFCAANNGKCLCKPGWRGESCTEQCSPNSDDCENDDQILPVMIEPEANMISDTLVMGPSAKLEAQSLGRGVETMDEDETSFSRFLASAGTSVNLVLLFVVCILMISIFRYQKRLNQARQELYYGPSSGSTTTSSSSATNNYLSSDYYSFSRKVWPQNRPRMPTPDEKELSGKNLAARNILLGAKETQTQSEKKDEDRAKYLFDPRLEAHLISSQKNSRQNVYSDLESNLSERSYDVPKLAKSAGGLTNICIIPEENDYQVPKSPRLKQVEEDIYENDGDQIYEEIKPRSNADE